MVVTYKGRKKMDKEIAGDQVVVSLPLEKRYASILRLAVAGIASKMDFSWDKIEDLKLAAEEAFLLSLKANEQKTIEFFFDIKKDGLEINLKKVNLSSKIRGSSQERYSFFILTGLMDDVIVEPGEGDWFHLRMLKKVW